jgi:putative oxidoreductase
MAKNSDYCNNIDLGLLLLRIAVGGLMLFHGVNKLVNGISGIEGMLTGMGVPGFLAYLVIVAEFLAAILIILGIWTRAAAFVMLGNMVVAILMAHSTHIFTLDPNTGGWAIELPMFYLLTSAALCLTGGGKYAVTRGRFLD